MTSELDRTGNSEKIKRLKLIAWVWIGAAPVSIVVVYFCIYLIVGNSNPPGLIFLLLLVAPAICIMKADDRFRDIREIKSGVPENEF